MKLWTAVTLGLALSSAASAEPQSAEGIVRILGSQLNSHTYVVNEATGDTRLCKDRVTRQIDRYVQMTVRVTGEWQNPEKKSRRCLAAQAIEILKTSTGRPPVVGTLRKNDKGFALETASSGLYALEKVPSAMSELVDQKILVDLSTPIGKDSPYSVLTFAPFPVMDGEIPTKP